MESLLCCPLCGKPLARGAGAYACPGGHSFDAAKEGYVHLLPANQKHSAAPGDDKFMAAARRDFLSGGYYRPLLDALCALAVSHTGAAPAVLDAGCGEGYYTAGIHQALLDAGKRPRMAGTDISKAILRLAAKREKGVEFAVASSRRLPVGDRAVELLLNCFSPLALDEFRRVLRPGGTFLYVVPAPRHLWQMKEVLYDAPYPNEEKRTPYAGFSYETVENVEGTITLPSQAEIQSLFGMTPYRWKTPRAGMERLAALDSLTTEIAFHIHVFRREGTNTTDFKEGTRKMNIETMTAGGRTIAVVSGESPILTDVQSALDLMMRVQYETGAERIAICKAAVAEEFFRLSSGLAGEILQKFSNYQKKLAVYGDFSHYTSKPLRDFIYESNSGRDVFFTDTRQAAVERLAGG